MIDERHRDIFHQLIEHERMSMYQINSESGWGYIIYKLLRFLSEFQLREEYERKIADKTTKGEVYVR